MAAAPLPKGWNDYFRTTPLNTLQCNQFPYQPGSKAFIVTQCATKDYKQTLAELPDRPNWPNFVLFIPFEVLNLKDNYKALHQRLNQIHTQIYQRGSASNTEKIALRVSFLVGLYYCESLDPLNNTAFVEYVKNIPQFPDINVGFVGLNWSPKWELRDEFKDKRMDGPKSIFGQMRLNNQEAAEKLLQAIESREGIFAALSRQVPHQLILQEMLTSSVVKQVFGVVSQRTEIAPIYIGWISEKMTLLTHQRLGYLVWITRYFQDFVNKPTLPLKAPQHLKSPPLWLGVAGTPSYSHPPLLRFAMKMHVAIWDKVMQHLPQCLDIPVDNVLIRVNDVSQLGKISYCGEQSTASNVLHSAIQNKHISIQGMCFVPGGYQQAAETNSEININLLSTASNIEKQIISMQAKMPKALFNCDYWVEWIFKTIPCPVISTDKCKLLLKQIFNSYSLMHHLAPCTNTYPFLNIPSFISHFSSYLWNLEKLDNIQAGNVAKNFADKIIAPLLIPYFTIQLNQLVAAVKELQAMKPTTDTEKWDEWVRSVNLSALATGKMIQEQLMIYYCPPDTDKQSTVNNGRSASEPRGRSKNSK